MPLNTNNIFDAFVRHQINIERMKSGEALAITKLVKAVDPKIALILNNLPENYSKKQLDSALSLILTIISSHYSEKVFGYLAANSLSVVEMETKFSEMIITKFLISDESVAEKTDVEKTAKKVLFLPYQEHRLETWVTKLGNQKYEDVSKMVRTSAVESATAEEMSFGVKNAVIKSNNAAPKISDAFINQSISVTRDEVYQQNEKWVGELIWNSILDGRTTVTCGVRSNQRYDAKTFEPIGHSEPWDAGPGRIHWHCRSWAIPVTVEGKAKIDGEFVDWDEGQRTAIGAKKDYQRGDNLNKSTGKVNEIPSKNNNLKINSLPGATDYETWLRTQPLAFVQDTLGVGKAALFIDNKLPLGNFVVPSGRELTLKQLKLKYQ